MIDEEKINEWKSGQVSASLREVRGGQYDPKVVMYIDGMGYLILHQQGKEINLGKNAVANEVAKRTLHWLEFGEL